MLIGTLKSIGKREGAVVVHLVQQLVDLAARYSVSDPQYSWS